MLFSMVKKNCLLYLIVIFCCVFLFGKNNSEFDKNNSEKILLKINIVNSLTGRTILCPDISIYRIIDNDADSIKVNAEMSVNISGYLKDIKMPRENGLYLINFEAVNLRAAAMFGEEIEKAAKVQGKFGRTEQYFEISDETPSEMELPDMEVNRELQSHTLDEVEVTASKVKFYHKGDTLVYNADAFVLAEGSMLDALLKQMPGVELKKDGQIFVNGKKVQDLLLNGKDLFNGQRQLMLENLAAYTVKDIQFYSKLGKASELMERDMRDSKYVMDVKLKREYAVGWSVNTNAGYGTRDRYFGKLFGMWFTENASLTTHFNANNLNDETTPGANNESMELTFSNDGEKSKIEGGLTYLISGQRDLWELKGSVKVNRQKCDIDEDVISQNYLNGGDTFRYSWKQQGKRNRSIETLHTLFMKFGKTANLTVRPSFSYLKSRERSSVLGILMNSYVDTMSYNLALGIYDKSLRDKVVNLNKKEIINPDNYISGNAELESDIRLFKSRHMLRVAAYGHIGERMADRFERNSINYGNNQEPGISLNQYFRQHPNHDWESKGSVGYGSSFGSSIRYNLKYELSYRNKVQTSYLYNLENFAESVRFGMLPSEVEYQQYLDADQSYETQYNERKHSLIPTLSIDWEIAGKESSLRLEAEVDYYYRNFVYSRPENYSLAKSVGTFSPIFNLSIYSQLSKNIHLSAGMNSESQLQNMLYMMDVTDTTDPLSVKLGNPDLKQARTNGIYCVVSANSEKKYFSNLVSILYIRSKNAFARGYMYNPENGVTYNTIYNVNGNQSIESEHEFSTYLDKRNRLLFDLQTKLRYDCSVDMAGTIGEESDLVPPLRKVHTGTWHEEMKIDWATGSHRVSAKVQSSVNRYFSNDFGFSDFTSWTSAYGASGVFNLPRDWSVSTDMTLYMRRGYLDSRLNTTNIVWNTRISKSISKGAIVFFADGYDLLHQLKNVTHVINAQARTMTVTNVIPSYFMFHIRFRINREPKE